MVYKVVAAKINNDGTVTEGKRRTLHISPAELTVGGLYFLGPRLANGFTKLYRIVEKVQNAR